MGNGWVIFAYQMIAPLCEITWASVRRPLRAIWVRRQAALHSTAYQISCSPHTHRNLSTCLNIKPYSDQLLLHIQMCTHFHVCCSKIFEWKTSLYWLVSITLNYSKYFNKCIKWYKLFLWDGCINAYIFLW